MKMFKAELYRILRAKKLFILFIFLLYIQVANDLIEIKSLQPDKNWLYKLVTNQMGMFCLVFLLILIFCYLVILIVNDFQEQTIKYYLISKVTRIKYFFIKLLIMVLVVIATIFLTYLLYFIVYSIKIMTITNPSVYIGEFWVLFWKNISSFLQLILIYLGFMCLAFSIIFWQRSIGKTLLIFLAFYAVIFLLLPLISIFTNVLNFINFNILNYVDSLFGNFNSWSIAMRFVLISGIIPLVLSFIYFIWKDF